MSIADLTEGLSMWGEAPVTCSCGYTFTGVWPPDDLDADQSCPSCSATVHASWPGFTFPPVYVTDLPSSPGDWEWLPRGCADGDEPSPAAADLAESEGNLQKLAHGNEKLPATCATQGQLPGVNHD